MSTSAGTTSKQPILQKGSRHLLNFGCALLVGLLPLQAAHSDTLAEGMRDRHSIVGVWLGTIVRPDPLPTIQGLETFFADGNTFDESNSTLIRSAGHGRWQRLGDGKFLRTSFNFVFDAARVFTGTTHRTQTLQLSSDGKTFALLEGVALRYDAAGVLVSTTPDVPGTFTAKRLFTDW